MMLGMLCEVARDQLTLMNRPEGDCIFCLNSLCEEPAAAANLELLKLPCYHCFHRYMLCVCGALESLLYVCILYCSLT